jgi:hypothetical protein
LGKISFAPVPQITNPPKSQIKQPPFPAGIRKIIIFAAQFKKPTSIADVA